LTVLIRRAECRGILPKRAKIERGAGKKGGKKGRAKKTGKSETEAPGPKGEGEVAAVKNAWGKIWDAGEREGAPGSGGRGLGRGSSEGVNHTVVAAKHPSVVCVSRQRINNKGPGSPSGDGYV